MHAPSYYREQAEHARRMARLMHQPDVTETLLRMAQDFEDWLSLTRGTSPSGRRCAASIYVRE
jgi:hypothetical protein